MFSVRFSKCVWFLQLSSWIIALICVSDVGADKIPSLFLSNRTSLIALHNIRELRSHLVMYTELLKLSGTFCQKILWFFLDDVPILKSRNRNFWNSYSFSVRHNSLVLKFSYPFFYLISSTLVILRLLLLLISVLVILSTSLRVTDCTFSVINSNVSLHLLLSVRELAHSQPTTLEYIYGDPLTFKVYVNLQQRT